VFSFRLTGGDDVQVADDKPPEKLFLRFLKRESVESPFGLAYRKDPMCAWGDSSTLTGSPQKATDSDIKSSYF
jgi:hypothetical protein